jgi:hypothetical protein
LTTITGLLRAAARAADMNLRGASIDSMYSRIERVCGVARQVVEHVAEVDVGALAERHQCEKPMRRASAQSSTAVTSAPDCETKAMSPGSASVCAKLALRPSRGRQQADAVGAQDRSR